MRLEASANFFGFPFAEQDIHAALDSIAAAHRIGSWKVRLLLAKDGQLGTEVLRIEVRQPELRQIALAAEPVDSGNRFLFLEIARYLL